MTQAQIAVIGGSGLYQMPGLTNIRHVDITTPFGKPSDQLVLGEIDGITAAFLPRHGRHHQLLPTEVPYRANIYALKTLGVSYILAVSAVGSLQENYRPGDLVLVDQFFDWTRQRPSTFFGDGVVAHVSFAQPISLELVALISETCQQLELGSAQVHQGGTYLCMEGPAFSTYAESMVYRRWGMEVIGMTNVQEAKLSREAEIAYSTLAWVTDYDCWHPDHGAVTVEQIMAYLHQNVTLAQRILAAVIPRLGVSLPVCAAHSALKNALLTPIDQIPVATAQKLAPLLQKYLLA